MALEFVHHGLATVPLIVVVNEQNLHNGDDTRQLPLVTRYAYDRATQAMKPADQEVFRSVYRGRQSALHHMAYLRMAKVLLALHALERIGFELSRKRIFDYGFGAGTFLRHCPPDAQLYGVEIDPQNVAAVRTMLRRRGHLDVHLEAISSSHWSEHPLLAARYDLIVCSHVLEHLQEPAAFLSVMRRCLNSNGVLLGLVPINELADDPHHVQKVDRALVERWAGEAQLRMAAYFEADELFYRLQPLIAHASGFRLKLAQTVSLGLGIPATLLGPTRWWPLSAATGRLFGFKPTQAAFVLRAPAD
jgi:2-polyprenyl-3-methyl-5-hydroxy-6-metoxy-1,4-benzoquinol methylase